jgi:hypothetical protein
MPVRRSSRPAVRSHRRKLVWCNFQFSDSAIVTTVNTIHDMLTDFEAAGATHLGCTIMRIHMQLSFSPGAVGDHGEIGIAVGRKGDTISTLSVAVNPEMDWMLYRWVWPASSGGTVDAVNPFEIDLRAKRKLDELDQTLWFTWIPIATTSASMSGFARILLALP